MATPKETPGDRVADLEEQLERREAQLRTVRERYERLIDQRARLRRETEPDDQFVWTGPSGDRATEGPAAAAGPSASEDAGASGEQYRADGGSTPDTRETGWLARLFERFG